MRNKKKLEVSIGSPFPYGVSFQGNLINFCLISSEAKNLVLNILERFSGEIIEKIPFDPQLNKTGSIWHLAIVRPKNLIELNYFYIVDNKGIIDPYAKCLNTAVNWGTYTANSYFPMGELTPPLPFNFENDCSPSIQSKDLIIYEMHVRGFTEDLSSEVDQKGKFLGVIEKIPHLLQLGINAVELMPIQEFNECEYSRLYPNSQHTLYNYWGYSTVNFFCPMNRYTSSTCSNSAIYEFKALVKELHRNGIELILDMVFNHTAEGNKEGPVFSFKGLDEKNYYMLDQNGDYLNYTGCGNTFNANSEIGMTLILDVLRYWVTEMHVDGFRFDLASALNRCPDGSIKSTSALIKAISEDPVLAKVKLIAEPWDAGGVYQVGVFAAEMNRWSEWNDKYRDSVRRFIKGTPGSVSDFAKRISGSEDLYHTRSPLTSLNFITSHDGFTLADLVSYNDKHNLVNGEANLDGANYNESWNCGEEGETNNQKTLALRERQMRNLHMALMISQGIPMILMGDEYGHSKRGNNNTWCQDNQLNWFLWEKLKTNQAFYRFYRLMIQFRKRHPILRSSSFLTRQDIEWHGIEPFKLDWHSSATFIAFRLKSNEENQDLYIAFNAQSKDVSVHLPPAPQFKTWRWIVNTANESPFDIYEDGNGPLQIETHCQMKNYSALIFKAI